MKFGTLQQMLNPIAVTWPKIESFKIQDGGDSHLENRFFGLNSSTDCPISAKFCVHAEPHADKGHMTNCKFLKSKMADGRHLKNCYIAISQWKSSDLNEIWYTTSDIEPDYGHVTKNWNFWNLRWRRPPFWKSLFWPLLINRLSDFSEILCEEAERHVDKAYITKTANF